MKKITPAILIALALVFGYGAALSMAGETMSKGRETFEAKLPGAMVKNPQGGDLGIITGVVRGPEGRAAFAILNYWISDDTQKRVAVPLRMLSCPGKDCVLNASKNVLDSVPAYGSEEDLKEPRLAQDIYRYFGVQPYWTEEGMEK